MELGVTARTVVLLGLVLTSVPQLDACSKCQMCAFPDTMYDVAAPWRMFAKDDRETVEHDYRKVTFRDTFMFVKYVRNYDTVLEYKFACKKHKGSNKYWALRRHVQQDGGGQYTCIQFVFRAVNVVQLRMADPTTDESVDVCGDANLRLEAAPLVYSGSATFWDEPRNRALRYNPCPLKGGFLATWTDSQGNEHCNAVGKTTRLEAECSAGEGIALVSYGAHCDVPGIDHLGRTHTNYCLANWTEGFYTYMLLYNRYKDSVMPCMRFPTNSRDNFNAVLFLDGACRAASDVSHLPHTVVLSLRRQVVRDVCSDLNSNCRASDCGSERKRRVCRATCGMCPGSEGARPWDSLQLSAPLRGAWRRDTELLGPETVTVTDSTVTIPSLGTFQYMGHTDCGVGEELRKRDGARAPDSGAEDALLLAASDDGCAPRVMNVGLYNRSAALIAFRNGYSVPVKIRGRKQPHRDPERQLDFDSATTERLCVSAELHQDLEVLRDRFLPESYGWFTLVRAAAPPAPCAIPETRAGEWTTLRTGSMTAGTHAGSCDVRMEPHAQDDDSFTLNFQHCYLKTNDKSGTTVFNSSFSMRFTCVGVAQDNENEDVCIFAKTQPNDIIQHDYVSFVVSDHDPTVHMYYVGTCDLNTRLGLDGQNAERQPIATMHFGRFGVASGLSASLVSVVVLVILNLVCNLQL